MCTITHDPDTYTSFYLVGYYTDVDGLPIQLPCKPGTFMPFDTATANLLDTGLTVDGTQCYTCQTGTFNDEFSQRKSAPFS